MLLAKSTIAHILSFPNHQQELKETAMTIPGSAISHSPGFIHHDLPIGSIVAFAGETTKNMLESSGWMVCDGRVLHVAQYPLLFAAIGYRFGGSDGQFHIPQADVGTRPAVEDSTETGAAESRPANITLTQLIKFV